MKDLFHGVYDQRRVWVTGHTGFKGSWLALWLESMGAQVTGYALPAPTEPSHRSCLALHGQSETGDVTDLAHMQRAMGESAPEIVFHLAAQALVRSSYQDPVGTMATNVMGTAHLLEACRNTPSVKAIVIVTSDKCYQNNGWVWGYRESDPMGGLDPYSASKGCAELVTQAFAASFFSTPDSPMVASARAGNVIGGGDWARDRLIPDLVRGAMKGESAVIRRPDAIRPWQHVLEPLSGYLLLGERLWSGDMDACGGWNFGPDPEGAWRVGEMVQRAATLWARISFCIKEDPTAPHEAGILQLDCAKSRHLLHWRPVWNTEEAIRRTLEWYKMYYQDNHVASMTDLLDYVAAARHLDLVWTRGA